jgi:hypothetical protein
MFFVLCSRLQQNSRQDPADLTHLAQLAFHIKLPGDCNHYIPHGKNGHKCPLSYYEDMPLNTVHACDVFPQGFVFDEENTEMSI